jgi:hypothetical protein
MRGTNFLKNSFWRGKVKRRRSLARLPIMEKFRILVELQELAYPILSQRKKNQLRPWKPV